MGRVFVTFVGPLVDAWNRHAARIYFECVAPNCPNCHREFASDDKVRKHMTACCPNLIEQEREDIWGPDETRVGGLLCYICGRKTGVSSAARHIKACAARWRAREDVRPKALQEILRKEGGLPSPPMMPMPETAKQIRELASYNEEAERIHEEQVRGPVYFPRAPRGPFDTRRA